MVLEEDSEEAAVVEKAGEVELGVVQVMVEDLELVLVAREEDLEEVAVVEKAEVVVLAVVPVMVVDLELVEELVVVLEE